MWLPALCWIVPPLVWALSASRWAAVTTAISLVIWAVLYWAEGAPVRYALLHPLGAAMGAGIMLRSAGRASKVARRGTRWSGIQRRHPQSPQPQTRTGKACNN